MCKELFMGSINIGKKGVKPALIAFIIAIGYKAIKWSYINDMLEEVTV